MKNLNQIADAFGRRSVVYRLAAEEGIFPTAEAVQRRQKATSRRRFAQGQRYDAKARAAALKEVR